jgi:hypothetical protein
LKFKNVVPTTELALSTPLKAYRGRRSKTSLNKCKIKNWKKVKKTTDWEKSIKEANVRIGL